MHDNCFPRGTLEPPLPSQVCRLRDMTYAAPITVDCEYMRGRDKVAKSSVFVGRMPLMLRSDRCAWRPAALQARVADLAVRVCIL